MSIQNLRTVQLVTMSTYWVTQPLLIWKHNTDDIWDIWSQWWGNMIRPKKWSEWWGYITWPKKRQMRRQRQIQGKYQTPSKSDSRVLWPLRHWLQHYSKISDRDKVYWMCSAHLISIGKHFGKSARCTPTYHPLWKRWTMDWGKYSHIIQTLHDFA